MVGFINVNKPSGMSSAFAVGKIKKIFGCPCGHMGTLDPMASGVLPVGIGKASRLFPYLLDKTKTYVAEFTFGFETDTLDGTGKVLRENGSVPSESEIKSVLPSFTGKIEQIPPKFSAKCVDGKRGYELARKGVEFDLKGKTVTVHRLEMIGGGDNGAFTFKIECGGGTYIRSLCRDIAYSLNTFATMTNLKRTRSGVFTLDNAVTPDALSDIESAKDLLIPADEVVDFEKIRLPKDRAEKILNGVFENIGVGDGLFRVYAEDEFWGIGEGKDGVLRIKSYVR